MSIRDINPDSSPVGMGEYNELFEANNVKTTYLQMIERQQIFVFHSTCVHLLDSVQLIRLIKANRNQMNRMVWIRNEESVWKIIFAQQEEEAEV